MSKPTCSNCKYYNLEEELCYLPKAESKCRKEKPTTWCQWHEEREILVTPGGFKSSRNYDNREQREPGNTRSLHSYEERVEMGGTKVVIFWDGDSQEISISVYLEGEANASAVFMADLCGNRSRRTMPIIRSDGLFEFRDEASPTEEGDPSKDTG